MTLPIRVIEPLPVEIIATLSKPVIAPPTLIAPFTEVISMSVSLEAAPKAVMVSEKVTVPEPSALTSSPPGESLTVTALAKVMDVANLLD